MKKELTILIVDDNKNFVDRMISLLEEVTTNKRISTASNYEEARRLLSGEQQDIVLLDINMPGKNGIELLKFIMQKNNQSEVIMITNHADTYYKEQCTELGAKYFLDKSKDFALVPGIVKEFFLKKYKNFK